MISQTSLIFFMFIVIGLFVPAPSYAMHIMEGFLPPVWSIAWSVITIPFLVRGLFSIQKTIRENPRLKMLLAMAGAFAFVLSALKIPSVTCSCSHPTGVELGAIPVRANSHECTGADCAAVLQGIAACPRRADHTGSKHLCLWLLVGPFVAFAAYKILKKLNRPQWLVCFSRGSARRFSAPMSPRQLQLALAFPAETGGVAASLLKFLGIFAVTQTPLAISEGILTVLIFKAIAAYSKEELEDLKILSREA